MHTIPVHTILTHESPDLDGILSVLLLRKFGEPFFPGIGQAKLAFHSAGELPDGATSSELEAAGVLAVDIGGGRFDTHPVGLEVDLEKQDRSAADLVAEYLGVLKQPGWSGIIEYTRLHDSSGHNLYSREPLHGLFGLINIFNGIQMMHPFNSDIMLEKGIQILACIPAYSERPDPGNNFSDLLIPFVENYLNALAYDKDAPPPYLDKLLKWMAKLQIDASDTFPRHELDDIVTLKAIAVGAQRLSETDPMIFPFEIVGFCLEAIVEREKRWFEAVDSIMSNAVVRKFGPAVIVTINSPNGLTIKAARYKYRAALVIYQNSADRAVSFSLNTTGPLNSEFLKVLTAKIRIAECVYAQTKINFEEVDKMGKVEGWFLHQSGNILLRGSLKSTDFIPTLLSLELISNIVYAEVIRFLRLSEPAPKFPPEIESQFVAFGMYELTKSFNRLGTGK